MSGCVRNFIMVLALIAGPHYLSAGTVSLAWNPSADPIVTGYKIYYGPASEVYTTNIDVGDTTNATISGLAAGTTYYFSASSYDAAGDESVHCAEISGTVQPPLTNQSPTLDPIANVTINEYTPEFTIALTGISSGAANQNQPLEVAACSASGFIKTSVSYSSPQTTGTLSLMPVGNAVGVATITVFVNNGGQSNNMVTRTFSATVIAPQVAPGGTTANLGASAALVTNTVSSTGTPPDTVVVLVPRAHGPSGQFNLMVSGAAGRQCVVQASSDLVHWTILQTNTAPFVLVDTNAAAFSQRYYRAYPLPSIPAAQAATL
ncbi:MAG: fibronectin type III domain-containing protein [Verrucomicrobiota bacterium]